MATGRYQTASEVVREGLRLLELQERDREATYALLKKKLRNAAAQAERGELVDGEAFIDRLLAGMRRGAPMNLMRHERLPTDSPGAIGP